MINHGETFWLVWNPAGNTPTKPHHSHESAIAEAERLARQCRGGQFYVLEATDMRELNDMNRVRLERNLPF